MAPKPDKRKKPRISETGPTPLAVLVAKCSRSTLEALVLKSVLNSTPVAMADLEATPVPPVSPVVATTMTHLEGGGLFSLLPYSALMRVLGHLSTECKLTVVITTCKALRALRSEGTLWNHIDARGESPGEGWIGSNGLIRLLRWLSDPTAVKTLSLTCTKEHQLLLPYRPHEVTERGRMPTRACACFGLVALVDSCACTCCA
jgi:hypothetical protein